MAVYFFQKTNANIRRQNTDFSRRIPRRALFCSQKTKITKEETNKQKEKP
jgi:hypothetical protein